MESTLLHNISSEELCKLFADLQNQINELKQHFEPKQPVELLTRNEVAKLLKCDLSTIHNWCKKGKLIPYGIGNRVYFKRSEIELALINLSVKKKT
jgi:excisionase family DNA binding protein